MPSEAEQAFRDAFNAFQDTPPTMVNPDRLFQAAAAVIERAIADAVAEREARIEALTARLAAAEGLAEALRPFAAVAETVAALAPVTSIQVEGAEIKNPDDPFGELVAACNNAVAALAKWEQANG